MAIMFFATVCAFRLGHKCLNFVMGLSRDPVSFSLSHGPSPKATNHGNVSHQVAPVLACPAVPSCDSTMASLVAVPNHVASTDPLAAAPTSSNDGQDGLNLQDQCDTAADEPEPTATVAVVRRQACPKAAKPQAANTLPDSSQKQLESEVVKTDWQQYELLRACRVQNQNSDWYRAVYN
ncbi:hypothetical protein OEZ85_007078 [Tetradesmus obliquus]|uniref:Uncharacterized protein n=1 Tax=Tetradesmus obliquus TaxID=3088 RepID=A0ABY8TX18_TETOB|nr:hypothetical protein OEZ85_007078 [Tetradesmus obliquus]